MIGHSIQREGRIMERTPLTQVQLRVGRSRNNRTKDRLEPRSHFQMNQTWTSQYLVCIMPGSWLFILYARWMIQQPCPGSGSLSAQMDCLHFSPSGWAPKQVGSCMEGKIILSSGQTCSNVSRVVQFRLA